MAKRRVQRFRQRKPIPSSEPARAANPLLARGKIPFIEQARAQLTALRGANRKRNTVQESWKSLFRGINSKISALEETKAGLRVKSQAMEINMIDSQISELTQLLEEARNAFGSRK